MTGAAAARDDVEALARRLDTDLERGLSSGQARQRLAQDGPNVLRSAPRLPPWRRVLAQLRDPLVVVLLAAIAISLAIWFFEGRRGWPVDTIAIGLIVVANALIGVLQERKAEGAVAALAKMTAATSTVVRDGALTRLPSAGLVCGDLLVLAEGDAVGADARLLQAHALRVQQAALTGESDTVLKDPAAARPLGGVAAEQPNMVFKGTSVVQGSARALVIATGMRTEMGAIARLLEAVPQEPTPLQREVGRIGRMLGRAVIVVALLVVGSVLLVSSLRSAHDLGTVLLLGVSLAVAAVPEGLPAILSLVLALGVQRMAARRAIVKELSSVETLGAASVICTDKTGTLTRSEMTIQRVITASGAARITGVGYAPQGECVRDDASPMPWALQQEVRLVLEGGSLAGNGALQRSDDGRWRIQGDPTDAAFLVAEAKLGRAEARRRRFERVQELPFSVERKMVSTVEIDHEDGGRFVLVSKGAPDLLLQRCSRLRVGDAVVPLDPVRRARALADVETLSGAALRTLAVAYRPLTAEEAPGDGEALERDLIFVGTAGLIDPPRAGVAQAIARAQRAGIRVVMITGDHPRTAARIGADLGICAPGARALSGDALDALDDAALATAVRACSIYARVAPRHKLRIVAALQADGQVVAMTGDGVNDAPALKAADIGIAMGGTGTEVSKQAARMILGDDDFATIVEAVREGRAIFDNLCKVLRYLLSSNLGEVLTVFLGVVGAGVIGLAGHGEAVVLPLLATQILWINLVTDSGPALALGVDPPAQDVMARGPRRPGQPVVDARTWLDLVLTGLVMAAAALLTLDLYLPGGLIEGRRELADARTAAFTVLVLAQLFNAFGMRSRDAGAWRQLFANRWLWAAVLLSVGLQAAVVQLGWLNAAFGTVPLGAEQWLVCVAMASSVLWFGEIRKGLSRLQRRVAQRTWPGPR